MDHVICSAVSFVEEKDYGIITIKFDKAEHANDARFARVAERWAIVKGFEILFHSVDFDEVKPMGSRRSNKYEMTFPDRLLAEDTLWVFRKQKQSRKALFR